MEKILTIQAPIYGGKGGKGIQAVDQLLALFREEMLGMVGEDEKPNKKHIDKEWGEGYSCVICSGIESKNYLRSELRAKVEKKI